MCKLEDQCSIFAVFPLALMMMMIMVKISVKISECVPDAPVVVITKPPKKEHI